MARLGFPSAPGEVGLTGSLDGAVDPVVWSPRWTDQPASAMLPSMAREAPPIPGVAATLVGPDEESRRWLDQLGSAGPDRVAAIEALFDMLLRVARHEAQRRRGSLPRPVVDDLDDLARQAADDALAAVLRKLDEYRGASRFTTWAYKFAIFEVSTALRQAAWRGRSITIEDAAWHDMANRLPDEPDAGLNVRELLAALEHAVAAALTPRQRDVFVSVVVLEVPIDVVADRHGSSRGAVYKVLHDARRKLRRSLAEQGWDAQISGGGS